MCYYLLYQEKKGERGDMMESFKGKKESKKIVLSLVKQ